MTATLSEDVIPGTISFVLKAGSTTVPSTVTYDVSSRVVTLDPSANLTPGTLYTVTLSGAQDLLSSTMASTSWSFTTATADTTAPTVSGQTPANGTTAVPVDSTVKATFSEPVQPGTISFVLRAGATTVSSTVSYDPTTNMVSLTPTSNLATSTNYTVTLSGAQDRSGNVMSTVTWSFTTAGALATPGVSSQSPAPNAILFPVANSITATFNTSMSSSSITSSSFVLKDSSNNTVSATVSYSTFNNTATLNPNSNLVAGTTYTASLTGVRSSGGTTMATTTWSFTAGTADTTAPTASSLSPSSGVSGVPVASNVTATFSEDVQASTISFVLKAGTTTIATVTTYDVASRVVTLDPTANLTPGTTYTVTLSGAKDLSGNTMTTTTWSFTTAAVDTAPTASSPSPASGATGVVLASNVTATFNKAVLPSTISFVLTAGSTTVPATVTYDVASHIVTLDPTANLSPGTTYTATLSGAQDISGNTMALTSWSFTTAAANTTAPVVSSSTPASTATGVLLASNVTATFSESVFPGTISFVLKNGSTTVPSAVTYDVASHTVTLDPTANLAAGITYTATLSGAQDLSGNTMSPVSWSFTTIAADVASTVSAQSPASGATGVPIGSNVTAIFSESVIASTISFVLKNGATTVATATSYDVASHTVTLDPTAPLALGTTYTLTLSGAQDLAGTTMASTSWSFTTAVANTTAPTVSAQTPASGATGVPVVSRVTATFSESVISSTISFVLKNGSTTVAAAVTYDVPSQTVTLDPSANLAPGTTYTVTLSGAQDLRGNTMASTSWSFTTEAAITTAPTVTAQSPSSGATGVPVGSDVTATFSEDVLAGTISFVLNNGSNPVSAAVTYDPISRTATVDPNLNLAPSTTYTATLSAAQDLYGNVMTTLSWTFTTASGDTTAPTLISQSPTPAATGVATTSLVTATFSEDVQSSTISFTLQNGANIVPATVSYNAASRTVTLGPGTNLIPSTVYTVFLSDTQDLSGNVMAPVSWTFTTAAASTDTTPPTVITQTPASGATSIAVGTDLSATFSEDVQANTISFLLQSGSTAIPAVLTYDASSRTVTLDPDANLAPETTYTVTLSGNQDLWGNTMSPVLWSITTASADTTPPAIAWQSPAPGPIFVAVDSNVTVTFNEAVQASTISFVLMDANNNPVAATITYDVASRTVTLNPDTNLAPGRVYTATLSGVEDPSGNLMPTISWSFATSPADTTAPSVIAQSPTPGATGTTLNPTVTAVISEDVQATTAVFVLTDPSNTIIPATFNYDAGTRTFSLTPSSTLAYDTTYTVTLSGLQDLSGNVMTTITWSFTTARDTTPPTVVTTTPVAGATGVALSSTVTATFSEPVQPGDDQLRAHRSRPTR